MMEEEMKTRSRARRAAFLARLFTVSALLGGALAGCDDANPFEPVPGTVVEVRMTSSNRFDPPIVELEMGDSIRWINLSSHTHTTTSGTGNADPNRGILWDKTLAPDNGPDPPESFEQEFGVAGSFPYFCRIHEALGMKGTIVVS
jgi:plastocyanin